MHACYRFTAKLRKHKPLLDACLDRVTAALHEQLPEPGATIAIDASDLPAYAKRAALPVQGRPRAQAVQRPGRHLGPPLSRERRLRPG